MDRKQLYKTVTSSDFTAGGWLDEEQQSKFMTAILGTTTLVNMARRKETDSETAKFPKLHLREPITEGGSVSDLEDEAYDSGISLPASVTEVSVSHLRSHVPISMDTLLFNVEGESFMDTVMAMSEDKIASDIEQLMINGNTTAYAADDTRTGRLLRSCNGIRVQAAEAPRISAGGEPIQTDIFDALIKDLDKSFKTAGWRKRYKFLMFSNAYQDWISLNSGRSDAIGTRAMGGEVIAPFGIGAVEIPWFPEDLEVDVSVATAAEVHSAQPGPFVIETGVNDKLKLDFDNNGADTITLDAGTYLANEIVAAVNTAVGSTVMYRDSYGRPYFKSTTTGGSSEVDIQTIANSAYDTLGFTVAVTVGKAAGSGSRKIGGEIWLADPRMLLVAMKGATRFYRSYDDENDRINVRWHNYVGFGIEELASISVCEDVTTREM